MLPRLGSLPVMGSWRRSPVSTVVLVVYLAASIAGPELHHHADKLSTAIAAMGPGQGLYAGESPAASSHDAHTCTICSALHQAQTRPTSVRLVAMVPPAGEAVTIAATPRLLAPASNIHSRAPPPFFKAV